MNEEDLRETIDMMKDEFEEKGGVPLEKMIQEVKKQKRQQAQQMIEDSLTSSSNVVISKMDEKHSEETPQQSPDVILNMSTTNPLIKKSE